MKSLVSIVGILLIVFGISSLAYRGFTYTDREKVAEIGSVQLTADSTKTVYLSPIVGGSAIVAGIFLVLIGRRGGK